MLDERLKDLLGGKIKQVRLDCVRRIVSMTGISIRGRVRKRSSFVDDGWMWSGCGRALMQL